MPSGGRRRERPWWHKPNIEDIYAKPEEIRRCRLPPLIITRIFNAMTEVKYPTRPRRAKRKWLENLTVDGVRVQLSCHVEGDHIVVTNINLPRGGFERIPKVKEK